jgi:hypothetical protein
VGEKNQPYIRQKREVMISKYKKCSLENKRNGMCKLITIVVNMPKNVP